MSSATTIFPGWYLGRLPHLHVRATMGDIDWMPWIRRLFFAPDVERAIYELPPYAERGQNPVGRNRDLLLRGDDTTLRALTIDIRQEGDGYETEVAFAMTL